MVLFYVKDKTKRNSLGFLCEQLLYRLYGVKILIIIRSKPSGLFVGLELESIHIKEQTDHSNCQGHTAAP